MNTTLVILAAGLSSRFGGGGAKQMAAAGKHGEIIADFSVYDAIRAGFDKIVYVIKRDMEPAFTEKVASKIKGAEVVLVFQDMDDLPVPFTVPVGREKPWGTAHALLVTRSVINEPFMVINADDLYGRDIYAAMHDFLADKTKTDFEYALAGYRLENTVSEHGSANRGICRVENGYLVDIDETIGIEKRHDGIGYNTEDGFKYLPGSTPVSMNAFAFRPSIFAEIEKGFTRFLGENMQNLKIEYYLTDVVKELINSGVATVKVLPAAGQWYGFTHREDQEIVQKAIARMVEQGEYPERLF